VIDDQDACRSATEALKRQGFFGRDSIHPAQLRIASDVFTPSAEARAWAQSLLDQAGDGAGAFRGADGAMVDEAVLREGTPHLGTSSASPKIRTHQPTRPQKRPANADLPGSG
jgi:citrate lyase beta subunit